MAEPWRGDNRLNVTCPYCGRHARIGMDHACGIGDTAIYWSEGVLVALFIEGHNTTRHPIED